MSKYYCLIAGLPDLTLEDGKLSYTVANFKTEIYPDLSSTDRKLIDLFYLQYDNANLLALLKDKEAAIDTRGHYKTEELLSLITSIKEKEKPQGDFPSYFYDFVSAYLTVFDNLIFPENVLAGYYYDYAMKCNNRFVKAWFEFNLNINNVLSALMARKYKMDVASNVVGNTDIAECIRTSNARDFGVADVMDYFEQLLRISETEELVERERKIDLLKWHWMEEEIFFNYFTIERLFAFLLKLEMIERWIALDKEKGSELFRSIIDSLRNEVQIPAEFRK